MWLLDELYCIRDKIICVINGNHENRTSKDSDAHPLLDLAIALLGKDEGTRLYRDDAAFMKISVGSRPNKQRQISYNIFATHGSGGGRVGAGINRLQLVSMFLEGIDLVMMGHTHQQATHTYSKIVFDDKNMVLRQRPVKCLISGAWQNYGGYAMKGMLTPSAKGESIILLNGQHKELKLLS
jgi:predicted phosphodiesterase